MEETIQTRFLRSAPLRDQILAFVESPAGMEAIGYLIATAPIPQIGELKDKAWQQVRADAYAQGYIAGLMRLRALPDEMASSIIDGAAKLDEFVAPDDLPDHSDLAWESAMRSNHAE
jgi:hypothetical protein